MEYIDSHHHLWIPQQQTPDLGYGWLRDIGSMKPFGDPTPIQRDYEWPEYAAESDQHQMLGSVYVQVDGAIADPVAETAWVQSVFDKSQLMHGIVGLVDLASNHAQRDIEAHCQYPSFRGVRQILSRLDARPELCFASQHYLHDARWRDQFLLLGEHQLSFDLQLYPEQMSQAAEFFADKPQIPVIVDHAGSPYDQSTAGLAAWRHGLAQLASIEHIAIKLSGFGMFDTNRTTHSVQPLVAEIISLFGSDRVMYGSNFPVDKLMGSFDSITDIVASCCESMDAVAQQAIWVENCKRWYRLHTD